MDFSTTEINISKFLISPKKKGQYLEDESDRSSMLSAMRKTKSIDASCLDMRSLGDVVNCSGMNMPRAKSEFNLTTTATIERKYIFLLNPEMDGN